MNDWPLDDMLDAWEEAIADQPELCPEEFLSSRPESPSEANRKRFLADAAAIQRMDQQMRQVVESSPNVKPNRIELARYGVRVAAERLQSLARAARCRIDLPARFDQWHPNAASRVEVGSEIVPGYRLVQLLGRGGFGEVWKATGPGGIEVALKLIHCDAKTRKIERRSLDVIKGVRHPHLLSIFGVWESADALIIATELADETLADRLDQIQREGGDGIPGGELHEYMREAAEGIDALNHANRRGHRRIQHRDVKPQNLLLSGGSVKVGDFGLARAMAGELTGHTGSMTLPYAAPECLDGKTSTASDQYSLAVTYCQLRGGRLPFDGSAAEIMNGHLSKPPDLTMIPTGERLAVERALSKLPSERWPSCCDFIAALIAPTAAGICSDSPEVFVQHEVPNGSDKNALLKPRPHKTIRIQSKIIFIATVGVLSLLSVVAYWPTKPKPELDTAFSVRIDLVQPDDASGSPSVQITNQSPDTHLDLLRVDVRGGNGMSISRRVDTHIPQNSSVLIGAENLDGHHLEPSDQLEFHFGNRESVEYEIPADSLLDNALKRAKSVVWQAKGWFQ
jgi:serine/threonine protein kinase